MLALEIIRFLRHRKKNLVITNYNYPVIIWEYFNDSTKFSCCSLHIHIVLDLKLA